MVLIGAHTFAWSPGITDGELQSLMPRLAGSSVDFVELASYDLAGLTPALVSRLSAEHGLPVTLCSGLPRGLSLASADGAIRRGAQDHVRRLLEFAQACGALKLSGPIHGDLSSPAAEPSSADDRHRLIDSYLELRHDLAQAGIPFSIEPLNRYQSSLLNTFEQVSEVCRAVDLAHVGILVDIFHANMEQGHLYQDLASHRAGTTHVHLCGANRGPLGQCHLDWPELLSWLATFPATMLVSIETFDPSHPVIARRTRSWRSFGADSETIVLEGARFLKHRLGLLPP
ncbi:sugar phosphate isomerase/epimerase [Cyanobium sp. HWJ4-Hawea]|uniref:sugar phosphate isomerase/epimerase family protein n=1 Tax=unclassified Cyanobium TaxID=2627006 RepID=UPI0020CF0911|nr:MULTISPECIES: sugar phosphate isomerase/epimerase family protein [unclassified Cyanobium]MCP9775917.1 sugar phosphate isomerase/epimerase [Cyanobium sp. WAJ14-Wanaka]MCP9808744.1 sugar phosphate isomerase/epimerase [Cyanobium sp. HWJ4-Hawea]